MPEQDIISVDRLRYAHIRRRRILRLRSFLPYRSRYQKKRRSRKKNIEKTDAHIDIKEERGKMNEVDTHINYS